MKAKKTGVNAGLFLFSAASLDLPVIPPCIAYSCSGRK